MQLSLLPLRHPQHLLTPEASAGTQSLSAGSLRALAERQLAHRLQAA